jgi:hypothetical protein
MKRHELNNDFPSCQNSPQSQEIIPDEPYMKMILQHRALAILSGTIVPNLCRNKGSRQYVMPDKFQIAPFVPRSKHS